MFYYQLCIIHLFHMDFRYEVPSGHPITGTSTAGEDGEVSLETSQGGGDRISTIESPRDPEQTSAPKLQKLIPLNFCNRQCCKYFFGCICSVIGALILCIPIIIFLYPIGLIAAAIAPGAIILFFTHRYYGEQVTIGQMTMCFFEVMLWM